MKYFRYNQMYRQAHVHLGPVQKQMKGARSTFFLFQENICKKAKNSKCILLSEVGIGDKQGVITEKSA